MRPRETATLAIKVLALFVLTKLTLVMGSIGNNWEILSAMAGGADTSKTITIPLLFSGLHAIVILLFSGGLWFLAPRISLKIFPEAQEDSIEETAHTTRWTRVILGLMGVWLILNSFPELVAQTVSFFMYKDAEGEFEKFFVTATIANLLELIAGSLLLSSEKLIQFFRTLLLFQPEPDNGPALRISVASTVCPFCKESIEGTERWICRRCGSQHHQVCWDENEGCAVYGCSS